MNDDYIRFLALLQKYRILIVTGKILKLKTYMCAPQIYKEKGDCSCNF
jgi:hypothetical protein